MVKFSIIIPVYNEGESAKHTLEELRVFLDKNTGEHEIIAVDDGSDQHTKNMLKEVSGIKLITHDRNRGYGAALKTGVKNSSYDWVMFFDSDGQHKTEYIPGLLKHTDNYDMVVGARSTYKGPFLRQPGKRFLKLLAEYLVNAKIPDLNSGFRLIKKSGFFRFMHLFPNSFSLTTTITLAFFREGLDVKYIPITINKRGSSTKSTVKTKHGLQTILLIMRMIMLFNPLKIFLPTSLLLLLLGIIFSIYGIIAFGNFPISGLLILLTSFIVFFNGLLADQTSTIIRNEK